MSLDILYIYIIIYYIIYYIIIPYLFLYLIIKGIFLYKGMTLNFDVNPNSILFNLIHSLMASPILSNGVALSISVVNSTPFTNNIPLSVPTNHCLIYYLILKAKQKIIQPIFTDGLDSHQQLFPIHSNKMYPKLGWHQSN